MSRLALVVLAALALAAAPATAQETKGTLIATVTGEHSSDHVMEIPRDSRSMYMNFTLGVRASNFACAQAKEVKVTLEPGSFKAYAGASVLHPKHVTIPIPPGEPGINAQKTYTGTNRVTLELKWAEDTPDDNHQDYVMTAEPQDLDTSGCVPVEFVTTAATYKFAAHMEPRPASTSNGPCDGELATLVDECDVDPSDIQGRGGGDAPNLGAGVGVLVAAFAVAWMRRRSA